MRIVFDYQIQFEGISGRVDLHSDSQNGQRYPLAFGVNFRSIPADCYQTKTHYERISDCFAVFTTGNNRNKMTAVKAQESNGSEGGGQQVSIITGGILSYANTRSRRYSIGRPHDVACCCCLPV